MSINIDGREYEVVETKVSLRKGDLIVRPVKQEPKYRVELIQDAWDIGDMTIEIRLGALPKNQAQLIKEAVEALMTDIMELDADTGYALVKTRNKARQSMRENN